MGQCRGRPVELGDDEQQEDMSEDEEWGPSRLGYAACKMRDQAWAHRAERAVNPDLAEILECVWHAACAGGSWTGHRGI